MKYVPTVGPTRKRASHERARLYIGIAAIAVFIFIFAYGQFHSKPQAQRTDIDTGCPVDQPPSGQVVVLVDNTDPFSRGQVAEFKRHLDDIRANMGTGDMLTVASIGGELPPDTLFSYCSPEQGHVFGFLEALRHSDEVPAEIRARYERNFEQPLERLERQMPLNRTTPYSPIIDSLGDVIHQIGPQWDEARTRSLVVFSDLLENTPEFSQYHGGNSETFLQARSTIPYIRNAQLDLRKTAVTVYQLTGRPATKHLQTKANERFWMELFTGNGGQVKKWVRLTAQEP